MLGSSSPISTSLGQKGSVYINTGDPVTGSFGILYALDDCTIATLVSGTLPSGDPCMADPAGTGTLSAVVLVAGQSLYGYWTSITMTSGRLVAYRL